SPHADLASPPDLASSPDLAAPGFGQPCGDGDVCGAGLLCLPGPAGGSFCSKTCPPTSSGAGPAAPAGTVPYSLGTYLDTMGNKGCAFLCQGAGKTYACPGQLTCETADDPPGSGQRLCVPM